MSSSLTGYWISGGFAVFCVILSFVLSLYKDAVPDIGRRRRHIRAFFKWASRFAIFCLCSWNLFWAFRIQPPITAPKVILIAAAVALPFLYVVFLILLEVVRLQGLSLQQDGGLIDSLELVQKAFECISEFNQGKLESDSEVFNSVLKMLQEDMTVTVASFKALAILAQKLKMPEEVRAQLYELLKIEPEGFN